MDLKDSVLYGKKHIHFIGIGGSGMYPLAQILNSQGFNLSGSDNNRTDTLDKIESMGIKVFMGQRESNINGADLIVHSAAIMEDNEELVASKKSGVPVLERSELLGIITSHFNNAICISGTHGKTTATSMLTQIMMECEMDPSVVVGGKLKAIDGSGRVGKSEHMICEACEFVDTFLKLSPDISLILNIDEDHMDYFKTMENLIASFNKFAKLATKSVIINGDDENSHKAVIGVKNPIITFGLSENNDYYATNITQKSGVHTNFDLMYKGSLLTNIDIFVPGIHNVLNAVAACTAAIVSGANPKNLNKGLSEFRGAGRRFEVMGVIDGVTVVDDYAHHPAEISVTLDAANSMDYERVIAIHQPFTYSRTKKLLDDFATVLKKANLVFLSKIMGSREKNTYNIYAQDLADKIPQSKVIEEFEDITEYVCSIAKKGDLIITMGCGDINKCADMIVKKLKNK